uniref:Uncharacterized protein n=1 Tax=Anguilla anguilla TaxID=7936 RepID=A0A0E9UCC0_ANGAN
MPSIKGTLKCHISKFPLKACSVSLIDVHV